MSAATETPTQTQEAQPKRQYSKDDLLKFVRGVFGEEHPKARINVNPVGYRRFRVNCGDNANPVAHCYYVEVVEGEAGLTLMDRTIRGKQKHADPVVIASGNPPATGPVQGKKESEAIGTGRPDKQTENLKAERG